MLPSPLRPLVPVSALALLGWCWYTLRKRRRGNRVKEERLKASGVKMHNLKEIFADQEVAANNLLMEKDIKMDFTLEFQEKQEHDSSSSSSPYSDQNLDLGCSNVSSVGELSVVHEHSQGNITTSTPIVRLRPEPEGEVSQAEESSSVVEKPEMETEDNTTTFKGRSEIKTNEIEPSAQKPAATDVICNATEETTVTGVILKVKDQEEPKETLHSQIEFQKDIRKNKSLSLSILTKTVDESPSICQTGEDSGYSMSHSEDGTETEVAFYTSAVSDTHELKHWENGEPLTQKSDSSEGANGIRHANSESRVISSHATQAENSSLTLWDIEVPAHLVGRLIGKQGKHIGFLKQNSGAKIYVSTLPYTHDFQICHIEGSEVQVENALAMIRKKFKDLDLSNRHSSLQPATLSSFPLTYWMLLPQDRNVEVIVSRVETANGLFVQQHTHPSYYALCSLHEQMLFCYSHPGCPSLPPLVEAGVLCATPSADGGWWRAQIIQHYTDSNTVQIRYVDYGGYMTVNLSSLRQIRSDFVTLPFQATEVMLEKIAPLPGKTEFSFEAKEALEELTQGVSLIIKVTGSQGGLPLVHLWRPAGEKMVSVNGMLVERGLCSWLDSH
ncbi:A-kinase anchor protein 1, mitochondrial [Trichomycterus rosablanca]|uniref:A-kinase anchor protein 1, mitochondrial n=1 Tax=Trichomycterus rosablanca TaxID=2290929 RepID=UPI002F35C088